MVLTNLAEKGWLPDWLIRVGIRRLLNGRLRQERGDPSQYMAQLVQALKESPIALAAEKANAQHYEVPAAFFQAILGPRLKYSSCLYEHPRTTLEQAEEAMLRLTCARAEVEDGMDVLDLGCGWGSLSLWIAEQYPRARVTALSNSASQKNHILARAAALGLDNLRVITANIASYDSSDYRYDRVLSIEMFEHMRNYEALLGRIASWLRPAGKLFVHIFCHRRASYPFETNGDNDWMARHFFTGGLMPSFDLLGHFDRDLVIRRRWQVDGRHYARTCEDWLRNLDRNHATLRAILKQASGDTAPAVLLRRWRMFLMACAELFAFAGGKEWFVGHYLLEPCPRGQTANPTELHQNPLESPILERLAT